MSVDAFKLSPVLPVVLVEWILDGLDWRQRQRDRQKVKQWDRQTGRESVEVWIQVSFSVESYTDPYRLKYTEELPLMFTCSNYLVCLFLKDIFGAFCTFMSQTGQLKSRQETGERGKDMQQRARGGIEPVATETRTKPPYVVHLLHQLSPRAPQPSSF